LQEILFFEAEVSDVLSSGAIRTANQSSSPFRANSNQPDSLCLKAQEALLELSAIVP
jgi:hypothetical protein